MPFGGCQRAGTAAAFGGSEAGVPKVVHQGLGGGVVEAEGGFGDRSLGNLGEDQLDGNGIALADEQLDALPPRGGVGSELGLHGQWGQGITIVRGAVLRSRLVVWRLRLALAVLRWTAAPKWRLR